MPSVGRKFLLAGKGGLNLTHAEPHDRFRARYSDGAERVAGWLEAFGAQAVRDWAAGLGIDTFVGSSGKVFPAGMKAAPLLRAWVQRLRASGVRLHMRHRWQAGVPEVGADGRHGLVFDTPAGAAHWQARAVVLALGGASWARLGSDGRWQAPLVAAGVAVTPLEASNCGFEVAWSPVLAARHAGAPLKNVVLRVRAPASGAAADAPLAFERLGECVLSAAGLEGHLVYAASHVLRRLLAQGAPAAIELDLLPQRPLDELTAALARGRGARSLPNHVKEQTGLSGARFMLLREGVADAAAWTALVNDPAALARRIKALPLTCLRARPIDEAISSAGGLALTELDEALMLHAHPGLFAAGEMLDWDAPTGGYLLTACLAGGRCAGQGAAHWLARPVSTGAAGRVAGT
jgi:uncharacterized flavoprotein (TIGR03862 family)